MNSAKSENSIYKYNDLGVILLFLFLFRVRVGVKE